HLVVFSCSTPTDWGKPGARLFCGHRAFGTITDHRFPSMIIRTVHLMGVCSTRRGLPPEHPIRSHSRPLLDNCSLWGACGGANTVVCDGQPRLPIRQR